MFDFLHRTKAHSKQLLPDGVDMHSHILPGVDDGSPDAETSLTIIRHLIQSGLTGACCTPHIMLRYPGNTPASLRQRFDTFRQTIDQHLGPGTFHLHLAAEYMIDEGFATAIRAEGAPLRLPGERVLIELPQYLLPDGWMDALLSVRDLGYTPVLAHPERYIRLLDTDDLRSIVAQGIQLQGNIGSLTGLYGKPIQQRANELRALGLYTLWGTDVHSPGMARRLHLNP